MSDGFVSFRFNHTMPDTSGYDELMRRIVISMSEGSVVCAPVTAVRPHMVSISIRDEELDGIQLGLDSCGD